MANLDCDLIDVLMRPITQTPVLSVVVPTFRRPDEMTLAVSSIAGQIDADLAGKVEIIVTDNASGPETADALKRLAETFASVNYMIHAKNEGGPLQICAAPFRARGRWTWVFGDDDALANDSLKPIVALLEREQPGFLTINRQVWNKGLDTLLTPSKHNLGDVKFDSFLDLLALFGFDQLSFLTSQIYASEAARAVDPELYSTSHCRYSQLAYYVEAFHALPSYYLSTPSIWHRWDPDAKDVHKANFHHLATFLPDILQTAAGRAGLDPGLFEQIGGRRQLPSPPGPGITFVDNILENLWRSVAVGTVISEGEWDLLAGLSAQWRPQRAEQLGKVRDVSGIVQNAVQQYETLVAEYRRIAAAGPQAQSERDSLDQLAPVVKFLEDNINEARGFAVEMAGQFH